MSKEHSQTVTQIAQEMGEVFRKAREDDDIFGRLVYYGIFTGRVLVTEGQEDKAIQISKDVGLVEANRSGKLEEITQVIAPELTPLGKAIAPILGKIYSVYPFWYPKEERETVFETMRRFGQFNEEVDQGIREIVVFDFRSTTY